MTIAVEPAPRARTNSLFNDNRMKLGLFGPNVSNGCAITLAEGRLEMNWPNALAVAREADAQGMEALVPVARWQGFGGPSNFNGTSFETYAWAAGIAQATEQICVLSTSHVPMIHPIMAAKQGTTIDHISGGRYGLNVVCGWFRPEMEMFGAPLMSLEDRYDYATEWLEIVRLLWTRQETFDHEGRFFRIEKGYSMPKPLQQPLPPIMNAGGSPRGRRFAAQFADMAFVLLSSHEPEQAKAQVDAYRTLAREEFGREVQIWTNAYVVHGDTQKEAEDYLHYYVVDKGDDVAVDILARTMELNTQTLPPGVFEQHKFHFKAGWGGYPLVGTADRIVDELLHLSKLGLDGVVLSWVDYFDGLERWRTGMMPRLEQAGLRRPYVPTSKSAIR